MSALKQDNHYLQARRARCAISMVGNQTRQKAQSGARIPRNSRKPRKAVINYNQPSSEKSTREKITPKRARVTHNVHI